jgi:oligopeptide transport system permease protein
VSRYIFKRLISSVLVLLVIITVSLWITRQAPSNPCLKERETNTCACVAENKLDRPVFPVYTSIPLVGAESCDLWTRQSGGEVGPVKILGPGQWGQTQYAEYLKTLSSGSLGKAMKSDRTVIETLASGLPFTFQLGIQALIIALFIGIPSGLLAGLKQNQPQDYALMTVAMLGVSIPNFVLGPLLISMFALELGWFKPGGWTSFKDSILPSLTLGLYYAAYIARLTRGGMLEIVRKDFIRTARAKGLTERVVVVRHALKGAMLPVVSYLGPAFAAMLTGSVVVEEIFGIPGVGRHFVLSAINRDYNMVLGTIIMYSTVLVFLNLAVDILYTFLDPQVSYDD